MNFPKKKQLKLYLNFRTIVCPENAEISKLGNSFAWEIKFNSAGFLKNCFGKISTPPFSILFSFLGIFMMLHFEIQSFCNFDLFYFSFSNNFDQLPAVSCRKIGFLVIDNNKVFFRAKKPEIIENKIVEILSKIWPVLIYYSKKSNSFDFPKIIHIFQSKKPSCLKEDEHMAVLVHDKTLAFMKPCYITVSKTDETGDHELSFRIETTILSEAKKTNSAASIHRSGPSSNRNSRVYDEAARQAVLAELDKDEDVVEKKKSSVMIGKPEDVVIML